MNTILKVAAATINTTPMDWDGNFEKCRDAIEDAKEAGCTIVCLPELAISGYGCEDMFLAPNTWEQSISVLSDLTRYSEGILVAVGLPIQHKGGVYNCVATIADKEIVALTAKKHLAGDGIHYETRQFKAWAEGERSTVRILGRDIPIGDVFLDMDGVRIGYEICEDAWVAGRPGAKLSEQGIHIILNPSASHFAFDKIDTRKRFVIEGSRAFGCAYIYSNLVGNEAGRAIYDGGAMIASNGVLLANGPRLHYKPFQITTAEINLNLIVSQQAGSASRIVDVQESNLIVNGKLPRPVTRTKCPPSCEEEWENRNPETRKFEEFTRAISLGLYDYKRKSNSNGFVISLSGGTDSAAVLILTHYMKMLGNVCDDNLVTTIYQTTRNSSEITKTAADIIAKACGAKHHTVLMDDIVEKYTSLAQGIVGRELTWQQDDIALQNIQPRVRGPIPWFIANIENKTLLTTSNRSEAAVGYCTLDGDTCGTLSVVAGVGKTFLKEWMKWVELVGPVGLGNIPEASVINCQQATAELRPLEDGKVAQTDEEDLMPYPILDRIEHEAIGQKMSPAEILSGLGGGETALGQIKRFFALWSRNQFKRERLAPGLHVDDMNLDPRTWCRFPILNGGFRKELKDLEKFR